MTLDPIPPSDIPTSLMLCTSEWILYSGFKITTPQYWLEKGLTMFSGGVQSDRVVLLALRVRSVQWTEVPQMHTVLANYQQSMTTYWAIVTQYPIIFTCFLIPNLLRTLLSPTLSPKKHRTNLRSSRVMKAKIQLLMSPSTITFSTPATKN